MCGLRSMIFFMRFFLFLFLLFSAPDSFAFVASSPPVVSSTLSGGVALSYLPGCFASQAAACTNGDPGAAPGYIIDGMGQKVFGCVGSGGGFFHPFVSCTATCTPPSSMPVIPSLFPSGGVSVQPGSFCDPSSDCVTEDFKYSSTSTSGVRTISDNPITSGQACFPPVAPTASTASGSPTSPTQSGSNNGSSSTPSGANLPGGGTTSCSSGGSFVPGTGGCECNNNGSFSSAIGSGSAPACNGGSPTSPTLSPVAPVMSNGSSSCPSGSSSVGNGSTLQCFVSVPSSGPSSPSGGGGSSGSGGTSGSGGSGGGSPSSPTNSNPTSPSSSSGSPSAPTSSGSSPVGPTGSTGSGAGTAPTSSGTSAAAPTASAASGGAFVAPTGSATASGLSAAIAGMSSTSAFSSIGFGSSWLPQSCPSAPSLTIDLPLGGWSHTFSVPVTYVCEVATDIRPLVLASGGVLSLLILAW